MYLKNVLTLVLAAVLAVTLAPHVWAEDSARFELSKNHSYLGEEITATLVLESDKPDIADVQGNIAYNDKVLEFVDCDDVTYAGGGNLTFRKFTDTSADSVCKITFTFKTINEGDGFVRLLNCRITDNMQNGVRSPSAETSVEVSMSLETTKITTKAPPETATEKTTTSEETTTSANETSTDEPEQTTAATTTTAPESETKPADEIPEGKLKSLRISTGYISPAFSYDVTEYEIKVAPDCTWLELEGESSREGEYIWYTGDENVYDGLITRTIAVRDSAGSETVYTFHISRMTEEEQEQIEESFSPVTESPKEESSSSASGTTRQLALEKNSGTLKKTTAAVGIVVVIVLVIIIALAAGGSGKKSDRKSSRKRKNIKHKK